MGSRFEDGSGSAFAKGTFDIPTENQPGKVGRDVVRNGIPGRIEDILAALNTMHPKTGDGVPLGKLIAKE